MRTFSIYTLGCKVNQYESSQIRQFLEGLGLSVVRPNEKPDLFVINTCCVTATASAKSRRYVQRALRLNPDAKRVVCGCQTVLGYRPGQGNNLSVVADKNELPAKLAEIVGDAGYRSIKTEKGAKINYEGKSFADYPTLPLLTRFSGHTRAFLKVQDGCDGVCSYCIIPKVRPDVQSKPIKEAVSEAKALVAAGHKEIVVTGVNLGAYGRETVRRNWVPDRKAKEAAVEDDASHQLPIANLLEELAKIEGLRRLRVSSLEPGDINNELLDVFCEHRNIMPHIHLSVQSGSERILKRMCRPYSAEELREKIALIKRRLDRPAITCDIIVGFPGETEEDFEQTCELARWAGFSKIHCFPFSARMGTPAEKFKDKVPSKVIKQRAEVLRTLGEELGYKFREQFVGETCEVLVEDTEPVSGRCERYFVIYVDPLLPCQSENHSGAGGGIRKKNEIIKVKITGVDSEGAEGEIENEFMEGFGDKK